MYARDYRARAREMLAGKWGMALLVTLIAAILGGLVTGTGSSIDLDLKGDNLQMLPEIVRTYLIIAVSVGGILGIIQFIIGGTVRLGYCKYLLKLHDGEEGELKDLFSEFSRLGDALVMEILRSLYTVLWTFLFIIPGIIATYKYSMASFILLENPGMRPNEAITASKELMNGHKFELFCLGWSFFGWALLNILTLGIGGLWLNPYINASYAAFYRNISGGNATCNADASEPNNPW